MDSDNPHTYQGYPMLPVTAPESHETIGWFVPYLSEGFLTEEEARQAIDNRISQIQRDLLNRMGR